MGNPGLSGFMNEWKKYVLTNWRNYRKYAIILYIVLLAKNYTQTQLVCKI